MITVVVVIHLLVAMAMIGLILLQKSEGNSAGAGFSGSGNISSMMQPRARPNPLSRATVFFGIAFFATSIGLSLLSKQTAPAPTLLAPDASTATPVSTGPAPKVNDLREPAAAEPAAGAPASTPAPTSTGATPPAAAPATPPAAPQVPVN